MMLDDKAVRAADDLASDARRMADLLAGYAVLRRRMSDEPAWARAWVERFGAQMVTPMAAVITDTVRRRVGEIDGGTLVGRRTA